MVQLNRNTVNSFSELCLAQSHIQWLFIFSLCLCGWIRCVVKNTQICDFFVINEIFVVKVLHSLFFCAK